MKKRRSQPAELSPLPPRLPGILLMSAITLKEKQVRYQVEMILLLMPIAGTPLLEQPQHQGPSVPKKL